MTASRRKHVAGRLRREFNALVPSVRISNTVSLAPCRVTSLSLPVPSGQRISPKCITQTGRRMFQTGTLIEKYAINVDMPTVWVKIENLPR